MELTRWPERFPLFGRSELLLHCVLETWLGQTRGTPNLQLDMLRVIDAVSEQNRREIDIREVTAVEVV